MKPKRKPSKKSALTARQGTAPDAAIVPANAAKRLTTLENVIAKGMRSFIAVGRALAEIRDKKLYTASGFASFPDYVKGRYGWNKSYGHQLIKSSGLCASLSTIVDSANLPAHEGQVRPLLRLESKDAGRVWTKVLKASERSDEPITAERVAEAAAAMFPQGRKSKSATRRADRTRLPKVKDVSKLSDANLRKQLDGGKVDLLILIGPAQDAAKSVSRFAPFMAGDGLVVAQVSWQVEPELLEAFSDAGLTALGKINFYPRLSKTVHTPSVIGTAHTALWVASTRKRASAHKLLMPDPLATVDAKPDASLSSAALETLIESLSRKGDMIAIPRDAGSGAAIAMRLGRRVLGVAGNLPDSEEGAASSERPARKQNRKAA